MPGVKHAALIFHQLEQRIEAHNALAFLKLASIRLMLRKLCNA
jgi:hypothetical protein